VYTRGNHGQSAVLPRAACGGPRPVTRHPSSPADWGRSASCGLPTRLAAGSGVAGALGGVGSPGHVLVCAPVGAGWHGVDGHGRWKRPFEFLTLIGTLAAIGSGSPCRRLTSLRVLVLCPWADDTCTRRHVVRRRRVTGFPQDRNVSRRGEGLPGYGAILFGRAMDEHPAGYGPLLAHHTEKPWLPSGTSGPWASGKVRGFGAACPMARTFACLRIAEAIAGPSARLATGSGGLTLSRAGFAPAGRQTPFHGGIVSSSPN